MADEIAPTIPSDRVLDILEPILAAESLDAAVAEAARQIGEVLPGTMVGLVVVLHGTAYLESWHPAIHGPDGWSTHLRDAAIESVRDGHPVLTALSHPDLGERAPYLQLLPLKERLTAALCLVAPQGLGRELAAFLDRIGQLVALRLTSLVELESERRQRAQLQHWFHSGDRQVRALELERQKLSTLIKVLDPCVFLVDENRVIQWSSKRLLEWFPLDGERSTWAGVPCLELCQRLGAPGSDCGSCVVDQVFTHGEAVRCEIPSQLPGRTLQIQALPLRGPGGGPQQVMVTLTNLETGIHAGSGGPAIGGS